MTAVVALKGGVNAVLGELLERLRNDRESLTPLSSALAWVDYPSARPVIDHVLASASPALLQLGIEAAIDHRVEPGSALERALDSDAAPLRASGLRALGRLGVNRLQKGLKAGFDDQDAPCRFWAAWSAVRLGDRAAIPLLGQFAGQAGPFTIAACDVALRAVDPQQAIRAHSRLRSIPGHDAVFVIAAGIIGDSRLVAWLLDAMDSPVLARRAGTAFCLMTGCDLRRDDLDASPPAPRSEDAHSGAESDGHLELREGIIGNERDDDLVWPDSAKVRRWWSEREQGFVPGLRYIAGLPATNAQLRRALNGGNQWQRAAAALEIALLNPDVPLFDVMAPAHRQADAAPL